MSKLLNISIAVLLLAGTTALADWDPGEDHKMHYPQLPDPLSWDVSFTNGPLGDDWQCSQTGPVDDVHMWVSFRGDQIPSPEGVVFGFIEIWSNAPADAIVPYSRPFEPLWGMGFDTMMPNVKLRFYEDGEQRWLEPWYPDPLPEPDHFQTWQINIDPISEAGIEPFFQQEGEIYWLVSHMGVDDPNNPIMPEIGWKTSGVQQFMDDGVYQWPGPVSEWEPLVDPFTMESLDLAFVITPEPATLSVLALGAIAALLRRRK